jgi:thiosulfate dehydrogenase [quinone] large subunit
MVASTLMRETVALWMLLPLRLYTGVAYVRTGLGKIANHWLSESTRLEVTIAGWLAGGKPYHFYEGFLRSVVQPHAKLFSFLIVIGEISVGAALVLGLFTRPFAIAGLFMTLNFLLGQGEGLTANSSTAFVMILLTFALVPSGRVFGLDHFLRGKAPKWAS